MEGRVPILVAGDEHVFVHLLERFPPARYLLLYSQGLAAATRLFERHAPRLVVVRLDGEGWQLTPVLRAARALKVPVLGLAPADADAGWVPTASDRLMAPTPPDAVVSCVCELLQERRRTPRMETELSVELEGQPAVATTGSANSLFVPWADPPRVGSAFQIAIDAGAVKVSCLATVIRTDEAGRDGMVLGIPDGRARAYLDRIVRRTIMGQHYQQTSEIAGAAFPQSLSRKIALRSRQLLLEIDSEVLDQEDETDGPAPAEQAAVTQEPAKQFRIPQNVMLPVEAVPDGFSIDGVAQVAPLAVSPIRGVEVEASAIALEGEQPAAEEDKPPLEVPLPPDEETPLDEEDVAGEEEIPPIPDGADADIDDELPPPGDVESEPQAPADSGGLTIDGLAARLDRLALSMITRDDLQGHLEAHSALAGAADALQQRILAMAERVDRISESELVRKELQRHLRDQSTAINILKEDLTKVARSSRESQARLRDGLKQLRQQVEVQETTLVSVDGRFDEMAKNVARELKRVRDGQASVLQRIEELASRGDEIEDRIASHRAASELSQAQLDERLSSIDALHARLEEIAGETSTMRASGLAAVESDWRQQLDRIYERLEVQSALIETMKAQVENLSVSARNATSELQRAREARQTLEGELRRQTRSIDIARESIAEQQSRIDALCTTGEGSGADEGSDDSHED